MLNPFPILFLAPLAHAILRIITGCILITLGATHGYGDKQKALKMALWGGGGSAVLIGFVALLEIVCGVMFVLGILTQFAAIGGMILSTGGMILSRRLRGLIPDTYFYLLLFAVSLSLVITGAGAFAFDLPI